MPTNLPEVIEERNLSHAWARAFLHVLDRSNRNVSPLVVSITGFKNELPEEDDSIREALDTILSQKPKKCSCKISASTIFPFSAWNRRGRPGIQDFSQWYLDDYFPRLRARDRRNGHGTYFERMVRFQGSKKSGGSLTFETKNQLDHIISIWNRDKAKGRGTRHSAMQIAIFDPAKDHTGGALLGFPCLQQVSLAHDDCNGLAVSAYYPTQYIVDRAYGNYLGLCHLGIFMAREMGLRLVRLNSFIGLPELGGWTKGPMQPFADLLRSRLSQTPLETTDIHDPGKT